MNLHPIIYKYTIRIFLVTGGIILPTFEDKILDFIRNRSHEDGGYTLYEGLPDSKNTYYAIKSLQLLGEEPENLEKTLKWVEEVHRRGSFTAQGLFYRCSILKEYNKDYEIPEKFIKRLEETYQRSQLEITYYIDSVLRMHNIILDDIVDWIISQQNHDGGFGKYGSDIINTQYALEILKAHKYKPNKKDIKNYLKYCEDNGLWSFTPISYPPYIETVYAGFRISEILNLKFKNKDNILKFVLSLQNSDGGFRRSSYLGISELEYTYKALYIIKSSSL